MDSRDPPPSLPLSNSLVIKLNMVVVAGLFREDKGNGLHSSAATGSA